MVFDISRGFAQIFEFGQTGFGTRAVGSKPRWQFGERRLQPRVSQGIRRAAFEQSDRCAHASPLVIGGAENSPASTSAT